MASEPTIVLSDDSDREVEEVSGGPARQRVSPYLYVSCSLHKARPEKELIRALCRFLRGEAEVKDPAVLQAFIKVRVKAVACMLSLPRYVPQRRCTHSCMLITETKRRIPSNAPTSTTVPSSNRRRNTRNQASFTACPATLPSNVL